MARQIIDSSQKHVDVAGHRIIFNCPFSFRDAVLGMLAGNQEDGIETVRIRIVWVKLQGPFELALGTNPVPDTEPSCTAQRVMAFGKRTVKLDSL